MWSFWNPNCWWNHSHYQSELETKSAYFKRECIKFSDIRHRCLQKSTKTTVWTSKSSSRVPSGYHILLHILKSVLCSKEHCLTTGDFHASSWNWDLISRLNSLLTSARFDYWFIPSSSTSSNSFKGGSHLSNSATFTSQTDIAVFGGF